MSAPALLRMLACGIVCGIASLAAPFALAADPPAKKIPVLVDTDFGNGLSDAYALADLLARPEIEIVGITTCVGDTGRRAQMIGRFLSAANRRDIPFAAGAKPQPEGEITHQHQYQHHPAVIFNRMGKAEKEPAAEFMAAKLKARPGEITILCLGPLTNVARLIEDHPECKPWIKRIVISAPDSFFGGVAISRKSDQPCLELDPPAARKVLACGVAIEILPNRVGADCLLPIARAKQLFDPPTLLSLQLESLAQMESDELKEDAHLPGLAAVAAVANEDAFAWTEVQASAFDLEKIVPNLPKGELDKSKPFLRVATKNTERVFVRAALDRLEQYGPPAPRPNPGNRSKLVERGNLPARVHAFEDYETDIEKRWWMTGMPVAMNEPGNTRACRAVLTQDFDDRQGKLDTMYNAVVFNPVPGPPMGPNTRLTFRYHLSGTDTIRVQLYSLSNGYHRYLSVSGLKQDVWQEATVDMTEMRRPDGTGGPLAADERIDDIQFYVDCRATVKIDYMILYEAAPESERRPFPRRILFTGWFDTGKQGVEWPGTFETALHEKPRAWKYAKSVPQEKSDGHWIRVDLRGPRTLAERTMLKFDYRLAGGDSLEVRLVKRGGDAPLVRLMKNLPQDAWTTTELEFTAKAGDQIDEIWFLPAEGAELGIDDLLLYVPGK